MPYWSKCTFDLQTNYIILPFSPFFPFSFCFFLRDKNWAQPNLVTDKVISINMCVCVCNQELKDKYLIPIQFSLVESSPQCLMFCRCRYLQSGAMAIFVVLAIHLDSLLYMNLLWWECETSSWGGSNQPEALKWTDLEEISEKESGGVRRLWRFRRRPGILLHLQNCLTDLLAQWINGLGFHRVAWHVRKAESVHCFAFNCCYICSPYAQAILSEYPGNVWEKANPVLCPQFQFQSL